VADATLALLLRTGAFVPQSIAELPNIVMWERADGDKTLVVDKVSRLGELAFTAEESLQGDNDKRPTFTADFGDTLPAIRFDGVDDMLETAENVTVLDTFVEWNLILNNDGAKTITVSAHTGMFNLHLNSSKLRIHVNRPDGVSTKEQISTGSALTDGSWALLRTEYRGTHDRHLAFLNGVALPMDTFGPDDGDPTGSKAAHMALGSTVAAQFFADVWFRERLLVSPAPPQSEALMVDEEMALRWGVTLP